MRMLSIAVAALALSGCMAWAVRAHSSHVLHMQVQQAARAEDALPPRMLWVWERPSDLRAIDASTTGIAVLEETLRIGTGVTIVPRRQPFVVPAGVTRIGVVRIERQDGFVAHRDDDRLLRDAVDNLLRVAAQPGTAALQIDFDARKSERAFYRRLLAATRRQMPAGMPLEMTALASWCSDDDWIADLPVSSATPMFFRMEPDRRRLLATSSSTYRVTESLCRRSVGVSTMEPWPLEVDGRRVYLFADRGWQQDAAFFTPSLERREQP